MRSLRLALPATLSFALPLAALLAAQAPPAGAAGPSPLPAPALDRLEEPDRRVVEAARARLEALAGDRAAAPAALARAHGELGRLYLLHDFVGPAATELAEAARRAPDEPGWHYYLGVLRQREGDAAEARRHLERARALSPDDVPALVRLGETGLDLGDLTAARDAFAAALARDAECAAAHHGLGQVAYEEGRWRDAVNHLERALALQPAATALHHPLGLAYRRLGDLESARRHLERNAHGAVRFRDPLMDELSGLLAGARPLLKVGLAAAEAGDFGRAVDLFRRSLAIDPEEPLAHYNLALALVRRGDLATALTHFRLAIGFDPDYRDAHFNLATTLGKMGRHAEAAEHYRRAAEIDPLDHAARMEWAATLGRTGRYLEAADAFALTVEKVPESVEARFGEAMALLVGGAEARARSRLEEGVARLPDSLPLRHALARVLAASEDERVRDPRRALELAQAVFDAAPSLPHAETVAMAHAAAGNFGQAVAWQSRAVDVARRGGQPELVARLEDTLQIYSRGQPVRSPWKAP